MHEIDRTALVLEALEHVVDGQMREAARVMGEIGDHSDVGEMFGVCCVLAEAARQQLVKIHRPEPDAFWAAMPPTPHGECYPAHLFAVRFVCAFANGDVDTCRALYGTALEASQDEYRLSIDALLVDVGSLARRGQELRDDTSSR
jgi:hypothetical protein